MRQRFTPWAVMAIVSLSGFSVPRAVAASTRTSADDVITSVDGNVVEYSKTWSGCMEMFQLDWYENEKTAAKIVFGDDNEVYFLDLLSKMPMLSYVKGIRSGDKITVTLPQVVSYSDSWGFILEIDVNLAKEVEQNGNFTMVSDDGEQTITFSIDNEDTITLDALEEGYGIALMKSPDMSWYCVMENKMQFVPDTGSGVESVKEAVRNVDQISYYTLSGKQVDSPSEGIYVKRISYTDGSVSTCKVIF